MDPMEKARGLRGIGQQPLPPRSVHSPRVHAGRCVRVLSAIHGQACAPALSLELWTKPRRLNILCPRGPEVLPGPHWDPAPARA